jgi:polysaccharide export outer membrane protein
MGYRGCWNLLLPLVAALGLAGGGCQGIIGPLGDPGDAPPPYGLGPTAYPYRGDSPGVVPTSYTTPPGEGATLPPPAPVDATSPRDQGTSGTAELTLTLPPGPAGAVLMPPHEAGPLPTELHRVSLPAYRVAPPDILFLDTVRMLPKAPYRIEPLDVLTVQVAGTLEKQPIAGRFVVSPDGTINLGYGYGTVHVGGMTLQEAEAAVNAHLAKALRNPQASVTLDQLRVLQQARGQHLVRPDGTISLGTYGCVYVAGLTLGQIKCEIEKVLSQYVQDPQVSVDVFAYNSRFYYVIFDGGGYGQAVLPFPATGNETVLDAIAKAGGLPAVASKKYIWVARPSPCGNGCDQVLPVDWNAVTQGGSTCTNYQLFPGDRVYVKADCLVATDNWLAKILSPVERVFGITLLGSSTVQSIRTAGSSNLNNTSAIIVP